MCCIYFFKKSETLSNDLSAVSEMATVQEVNTVEFWASKNNLYISLFLGPVLCRLLNTVLIFLKGMSLDLVLNLI